MDRLFVFLKRCSDSMEYKSFVTTGEERVVPLSPANYVVSSTACRNLSCAGRLIPSSAVLAISSELFFQKARWNPAAAG